MCEGERRPKRLARIGLLCTAIYIVLLFGGLPLLASLGIVELLPGSPLKLNEVGDFLAGAFGPLALFWVVLGFFQQGEELQNSVDALNLQAKEMRASVEQQKAMLEVTRSGIEHEKLKLEEERVRIEEAAKPIFSISFRMPEQPDPKGTFRSPAFRLKAFVTLHQFHLHNAGGAASSLSVVLRTETQEVAQFEIGAIATGATSIEDFRGDTYEGRNLFATITYTFGNGIRERQEFHASSGFGNNIVFKMSKIGETQRIPHRP
ncbi:hypothetical protein SAMN06297129_1928 [Pseudooceanicola antarcticus]|uniref:Uncharacterized protein n=1 Tax=Pseudooceanicola antarcticus TaxID=1247613 RepID=A0A285IRW7_9RHOB|nr:hypothetical protein [Pseudooceanicola antarcticus]PJE31892.1 hypothetical protein CVM39_01970 [Pseudooceanicola antarcticus]SNY50722.1 hypothetical protein SAMN06297129_1928 [Pseudooceanicola antarcticus]